MRLKNVNAKNMKQYEKLDYKLKFILAVITGLYFIYFIGYIMGTIYYNFHK